MKFGLEIEKFLFDLKHNRPSDGVFRFIDALTDLELYEDTNPIKHVTNEFVLNLIEITTEASPSPKEVLKGYLQNYLLLRSVARRESATIVPMGAMPMEYQPHMTPKWSYFVQNSILDGKIQSSWMLGKDTPLTPAGNCAGMHIHAEVETVPEYLFSNRELQDKFNMGLMLTPLIAFSSSPYFFGQHVASSMRAQRYFYGVYRDFPLQGGLPPVMHSSKEVLLYFQKSVSSWVERGASIGLPEEDLKRLTSKKGANWNPIRWNKQWNTIELRCLDSDRSDYDAAKFIWVCGAMKRMDLWGEALKTEPMTGGLTPEMIDRCFDIKEGTVQILSSEAIKELFERAVRHGVHDEMVERYLYQVAKFAKEGIAPDTTSIFQILLDVLNKKETNSDFLLKAAEGAPEISKEKSVEIVHLAIAQERKILNDINKWMPWEPTT